MTRNDPKVKCVGPPDGLFCEPEKAVLDDLTAGIIGEIALKNGGKLPGPFKIDPKKRAPYFTINNPGKSNGLV